MHITRRYSVGYRYSKLKACSLCTVRSVATDTERLLLKYGACYPVKRIARISCNPD